MRIIKYIFFLIFIILLFCSFKQPNINLGEIWRILHVNSLIGLQKVVESSYIQLKIDTDIWFAIIIPILELPVFIFTVIIFIIYLILRIKYKS